MNCRSAESLYSAFLEDELNQEERRSLEAHLMGCRRCSVAVKDLKQTLALVGDLPAVETSPHFEDEIFDRIRSGEALRPTMVEWLGGFFTADRLRPVFLGGAAVCALWIAAIVMHPEAYLPGGGSVASRETVAPNAPDGGSLASSGIASTAPGTESGPAAPVFGPRAALASSEEPASTRSATKRSGEDFQWVDSQVPVASAGSDSALDPSFQDEYILDQFHLDRGDRGSQSIVPVSGNSSDDVYITF
jgi:anti-sigma factor RsiW